MENHILVHSSAPIEYIIFVAARRRYCFFILQKKW